ncbi:hypothetical protein ASF60_22190 [Methylobacterium sp. Leaf113]|uniref:hypothetical protein n=1 Tax=Methylobacterium sp. Leaf113 TaxID=1736259 RepID=UPI0006FEB56A|nr:hypothetical protein [Methylobacterium sp. Leaf113]KQP81769.1 hypothetical protein ASF60_22190 [Methylobacterium sp. Leaf113]
MSQGDEQGVAADIVRAFEEAAAGSEPEAPLREGHPDAVRLMDEAFGLAEAALGSNVLPFVLRKPAERRRV